MAFVQSSGPCKQCCTHEENMIASLWWVSPQCCLGELKHDYALQAIRQADGLRPCSPLGLACSAQPAHNKVLEAVSGSRSQKVFANLHRAMVTACMASTSGNRRYSLAYLTDCRENRRAYAFCTTRGRVCCGNRPRAGGRGPQALPCVCSACKLPKGVGCKVPLAHSPHTKHCHRGRTSGLDHCCCRAPALSRPSARQKARRQQCPALICPCCGQQRLCTLAAGHAARRQARVAAVQHLAPARGHAWRSAAGRPAWSHGAAVSGRVMLRTAS